MKDKIRESMEFCFDEVYPDECPHCGTPIIPSNLDGYERKVNVVVDTIFNFFVQSQIKAIEYQNKAVNMMLYGGGLGGIIKKT